jgi:hypothetical protein
MGRSRRLARSQNDAKILAISRVRNGLFGRLLKRLSKLEFGLASALRVDGLPLRPEDEDEGTPRCVHCKSEVCVFEDCDDHPDSCQLADGRWTCSELCWEAVASIQDREVEPPFH